MIDSYYVDVMCTSLPSEVGKVELSVEVRYKPKGIAAITQPPETAPFAISYRSVGELPTVIDSSVLVAKLQRNMGEMLLELGRNVYNARKKKGYISEELDKAASDTLRSLVLTTYCELKTSGADEEYIDKVRELGNRVDTLRRNNYPGVINE